MQRIVVLVLCSLFLISTPLLAQSWPSKPIRVYLPQPPGSGVDIILRKAFEEIQPRLGQTMVIENRPGGNSVVATEACAKAVPDGHTIHRTQCRHAGAVWCVDPLGPRAYCKTDQTIQVEHGIGPGGSGGVWQRGQKRTGIECG